MVRPVRVAVFPMLHPVAVLIAFFREPDRTPVIDFHTFGFDAWVHALPYQRRGHKPCVVPDNLPDFVAKLWVVCYGPKNLDIQRVGRKKHARGGEDGEISPRALYVKRKDWAYLFGRKNTMDEMIPAGKRRNHGLCVAIPGERTRKALGGMSRGSKVRSCEVAKM